GYGGGLKMSEDLSTKLGFKTQGNTLEMVPTVEAFLTNGTLLLAENCSHDIEESCGTARIWFDELPPESIGGYKDLKAAFLAYFIQQKKYVKDPVKIHNIKQKDGETIEDFMERFKVETGRMKGAPECMRISGFMHGVNKPELTKRLNEHVLKTVKEMMIATAAFIRGETAAASKKKVHTPCKSQTPKEIFAAESGKFKPPPPMVTPVEKRSSNKFCEFHNDKWHSTNECMQLRKQIEELRVTRQKVTQSFAHVKEITFPPLAANKGTGGPLVLEAKISGHAIYMDGGSSMEVLYEHCFNWLQPEIKSQMVPTITSLTGFSGETIWPLGQLRILVTIWDAEHYTRAWMNFVIVRSPSPYNGIIGRPGIREIQAITIGGTISIKARTELCTLLKRNLDIFAWQPSDMTGVPRSIAEHRLNVQEGYSPVRREKRGQAPERSKAIQVEVQKLMEAGILGEVYYHDWLSNPVMDCYPLPEIDWKVKSLCGYPFKCFLDAYKGCHQIQMAEQDEEKTVFHISHGVYCYTKMPLGLKNADATYRRLVDKDFDKQIGQNLEIYVDDLVID
nr:hypothetical protein [Tanacetum cinerariifolium]